MSTSIPLLQQMAWVSMPPETMCELAGITLYTLKHRWNDNPPKHAIQIMNLYVKRRDPLEDSPWRGWYFNKDYLVDDAGNGYGQHEIRAIFYTRGFMDCVRGDQSTVVTLKQELEKRIADFSGKIKISWDYSEEAIEIDLLHPPVQRHLY